MGMGRTLILEVLKPEDIRGAVDEIHDWWFDLDSIGPHSGPLVEIELRPNSRDFESHHPTPCKKLEIDEVVGLDLQDTERIGYYDVNTIKYKPGCLEVVTGIPLSLKLSVRKLQVRLYNCQ